MAKTVEHQLKAPFALGTENYTRLTLRAPTVGDMIEASDGKNPVEVSALLIARISNTPIAAIRQMSLEDMEEVSKIVEGFRRTSPATGAN